MNFGHLKSQFDSKRRNVITKFSVMFSIHRKWTQLRSNLQIREGM